MKTLKMMLLGDPVILYENKPIRFDSKKSIALLTRIALRLEPVRRDHLTTLLWGDYDESHARSAFRRTLSVTHNQLDKERLIVTPDTLALKQDEYLWVDILVFNRLLEEVDAHHPDSEVLCPDCVNRLKTAVELYRGDFLTGFTLRDSVEFDEWQQFEAEKFRLELNTSLNRLVKWHLDNAHYEEGIRFAVRWSKLDIFADQPIYYLMQFYAYSGQRSMALECYKNFEILLDRELGVEPIEETFRLYEQILNDEIRPRLTLMDKLATDTPKHNLPSNITPFIGREAELIELDQLIVNSDIRLITILAPGGMGKTRLAIESAVRQLSNFANRVYLVELAPLSSIEGIPGAIASALHFQFYQGKSQEQQIIDYLREKQVLLVIDNFEHLLDGASYISEILKHSPQSKILVTSRESLNLQEETRFRLSGIDFPTWETPENALKYSAVKLFMQGARRVQLEFELKPDELVYLARICRLVEGMPLAIILAAAWVEALSLQEIAHEISASLDFLETDLRNVPERHQSIRAVFDSSWKRLTGEQQIILAKLSVFRGGFTREAAQQVARASIKALTILANKSLLTRDSDTGRYNIHELLRQYAALELERIKLEENARSAHMQYYCQFLAERKQAVRCRQQLIAFNELEVDRQNCYIAWEYAVEQRNFPLLDQSLFVIQYVYDMRGYFSDVRRLLEKAYHLDRQNLTVPELITWARFEMYYGTHAKSGEEREVLLKEALQLFEECQTDEETSIIYQLLAEIRARNRDFEKAEELYQKALEVNVRYGKQWASFFNMSLLAYFYGMWLNRPDKGIEYEQEALKIALESGDQIHLSMAYRILAVNYKQAHDYETAYQNYELSFYEAQSIGNKELMALTLEGMGSCLFEMGKLVEARQYMLESIGVGSDRGVEFITFGARHVLGYIELQDENYDAAKKYFVQILEMHSPKSFSEGRDYAETVIGFAFIFSVENCLERAIELLASAFDHWSYQHTCYVEDTKGKPLYEALKTKLPSDIFQAVEARGLALDKIQLHADLLKKLRG